VNKQKKTKYLVLKGIDSCTPSQSGMCGRATPDIWPLCHCVACSSTSPATHSRVTTIVDKVRKTLKPHVCGFPHSLLICAVRSLGTVYLVLCGECIWATSGMLSVERKKGRTCIYTRGATCQFQRHYTLYCAFHSSLIVFV